jgi:hypothetical protein
MKARAARALALRKPVPAVDAAALRAEVARRLGGSS